MILFLFQPWQWEAGAVAIIFTWLELTMLMRKLNWIGIYIVMFVQIVRTFLKVVLSLAFAVIGFGISFYMLLENTVSLLRTFIESNILEYVM